LTWTRGAAWGHRASTRVLPPAKCSQLWCPAAVHARRVGRCVGIRLHQSSWVVALRSTHAYHCARPYPIVRRDGDAANASHGGVPAPYLSPRQLARGPWMRRGILGLWRPTNVSSACCGRFLASAPTARCSCKGQWAGRPEHVTPRWRSSARWYCVQQHESRDILATRRLHTLIAPAAWRAHRRPPP